MSDWTRSLGHFKNLRWLLLVLAAIVVLALSVRFLRPVDAKAFTVSRGTVLQEVRGSGTLESVQEVPLAFKVGGRIRELLVDEGSTVSQGQVLGRLDPTDLEAQFSVAQSSRGQAEAAIARAGAELEQVRATANRSRGDFHRAQQLHRDGILSRADLDVALEKMKVAEAAVQAAEASGSQARQGAAAARGTESIQRINLSEVRLLSPVEGLLVKRLREPGHIVGAGVPIVTVVSTRKLWIRAWVDEASLGQLRPGQPAQVELRSHPGQVLPGRVDRIGRQADRQTHEILVDVELLQRPRGFAVGQRADVRIGIAGKAEALRIPTAFLERDNGTCFVNKGGRVHRVQVKAGFTGSDFVEIQEGLEAGDQVLRSVDAGGTLSALRRVRTTEEL